MRKENYLKISQKLKEYNEGSKFLNKDRLCIEHTNNKVKIGGKLVDINDIIMTEYHGCKFPITPYLLASFEYNYTNIKRYYMEYGSKFERLFFKETLGTSMTFDNSYFCMGDYDLKIINDLDKLSNRYKILNTIIIPNGNKSRIERLMSICSKYYLVDNSINLVTVMLNVLHIIFKTLAFNKQEIFERYFKIDEMQEFRSKLNVSFDDSMMIAQALTLDWAINVFKKYLDAKKLKEIIKVIDNWDVEIPLKCAFKHGSKFKKYLEGKIILQELLNDREKSYKTRKSDYACEALTLLTESFNIKDFANYFDDDTINAIIERDIKTDGRKAIINLLCAKSWLTQQFELAHDHDRLEKENDELTVKIKELERKINGFDKAIRKRENRINVLDEKLKESNEKYKNAVLKETFDKVNLDLIDTKDELKNIKGLLHKTELELDDKTKQFSDLTKVAKKNKARLKLYEELFGDISEYKEVDESITEMPLTKKIDALDGLDIVLCGGSIEMENYFEKMGLKVFQVLELNDSTFRKNFDVLVVVTDMVSHQMVYKAKKQANAIGALCIYVQGTNKEKIIDLLYAKIVEAS